MTASSSFVAIQNMQHMSAAGIVVLLVALVVALPAIVLVYELWRGYRRRK